MLSILTRCPREPNPDSIGTGQTYCYLSQGFEESSEKGRPVGLCGLEDLLGEAPIAGRDFESFPQPCLVLEDASPSQGLYTAARAHPCLPSK